MKTVNAMLISAVLGGCSLIHAAPQTAGPDAIVGASSICELAAGGISENQTATVMATYKTDKAHYAYLVTEGCGVNGILNIGDMEPILSKTVRKFYDTGERLCRERGKSYVCVIEAKVVADIKIINQDGRLAAELLRIHEFFYAETDPYLIP